MLRDISGLPDILFAGKIFLLGGDFRQVLPHSAQSTLQSDWGELFKKFSFVTNLKAHHVDKDNACWRRGEFARWLLTLGNGELLCKCEDFVANSIEIPSECNVIEDDNIIDSVFPDLTDPKAIANTVSLTPTNETSLQLNDIVIKKVHGQQKTYVSCDKVVCDDEEEANNY